MLFKSTPGRVVQRRVRKQGRMRIVVWFKFDDKGFAEIDESKVSPSDLSKLKRHFEVVERDLSKLKHRELVELAKKHDITYKGLKKEELIKVLEVL